jgi:hypothetical protein
MAARYAPPPTAFANQPVSKNSGRRHDKPYLEWIRELPCIVTRRIGVEAAHISFPAPEYGKLGRGLSRKESDRWAIPLIPEEHRNQHAIGEREYWKVVGINPCIVALALYGAYPDSGLAMVILNNIDRLPSEVMK